MTDFQTVILVFVSLELLLLAAGVFVAILRLRPYATATVEQTTPTRRIPVLIFDHTMSADTAERAKVAWREAVREGRPIVLPAGARISYVEVTEEQEEGAA